MYIGDLVPVHLQDPSIVLDKFGCIIVWYLPEIVTQHHVVSNFFMCFLEIITLLKGEYQYCNQVNHTITLGQYD